MLDTKNRLIETEEEMITHYIDSKGNVLQLRSDCDKEYQDLKHWCDGFEYQQAIVSPLRQSRNISKRLTC